MIPRGPQQFVTFYAPHSVGNVSRLTYKCLVFETTEFRQHKIIGFKNNFHIVWGLQLDKTFCVASENNDSFTDIGNEGIN